METKMRLLIAIAATGGAAAITIGIIALQGQLQGITDPVYIIFIIGGLFISAGVNVNVAKKRRSTLFLVTIGTWVWVYLIVTLLGNISETLTQILNALQSP